MKNSSTTTAQRWHYTAPYILSPQHPITIQVIGAGGNGSQVLTQLARIDHALKKLGHVGLHVTCFDPDIVTEANLGRQLFSPSDLGMNKAVVLITRLNMYFGTSWKAEPRLFEKRVGSSERNANITISCVDTIKARQSIQACLYKKQGLVRRDYEYEPYEQPLYWLDLGNTKSTGQFIIGTIDAAKQPKKTATLKPISTLPNIFQKFPGFEKQKTKNSGPSCSLAEALSKQDLFINSTLVQLAMGMIWKMFREGRINYQGAFVNLETLDVAPIYI